ncbi:MAG: TonB-dependent receptor [Sedimenticola sp.]|nr:TonB-dependent receptor [Sedimenticola sp.]
MRSNYLLLTAAVAATLTTTLHAEERDLLAPVLVTATRVEYRDVDAPYASEVHTAEQIRNSGSNSLYDYLDKHTSLAVMPSYGNPYTQKIDMRGFGIGDGYQNIIITLNGRRLNNIDIVPQLLSAVPLATIDRIEITKGSGSVAYGDGATAGSIQIHTQTQDRIEVNAAAGNHGVRNGELSAGFVGDMFEFNLNASRYQQDGFSDPDITGIRDESDKDGYSAQLNVYPTNWLELRGGIDSTEIDTRYPGPLTLTEFNADPAQNSGNTYTVQEFETDSWNLGATAEVTPGLELEWDYSKEDKFSRYPAWFSSSNYDYESNRLAVAYQQDALSLLAGIDQFDGVRIGATNRTYKDNMGYFLQGDYRFGPTLVSAGLRKESVDYRYTPNTGATLNGKHDLTAWNIGLNHRYSTTLSLFSNLNRSFQAPDIDRFFTWGGGFNAFIEPAISRTLNVGANLTLPRDKLKATLFHTRLKNEIYYNSATFTNTNIDKSHKYGLELQEAHRFNDRLTGSINYTYTRAIIDREDMGAGAFDGKDLPGVSDHAISLGIDYRISGRSRLGISHTYRGEAYAAEDFSNSATQKQEAYHSTDLTFSYQPLEDLEIIASVKNLFEHENGIWVQDDAIYPVNFTRNWSLGMRASF